MIRTVFRSALQCVLFSTAVLLANVAFAQTKVGNDVTTPLHALTPDYPVPYRADSKEAVKKVTDRVFQYLQAVTPAELIHKKTGAPVLYSKDLDSNTILKPGDFRITSYEFGVVYAALQRLSIATGDATYSNYVKERLSFIARWALTVRLKLQSGQLDTAGSVPLKQPAMPHALDDAGAIAASMIMAQRKGVTNDLRPQIDFFLDYIMNKEYRLADGTLARNRPQKNTLWLDDLYMAVPAIAQMGALTGDQRYFDEAVKQVLAFSKRMWVPSKGLFMHGWVESMETHPAFHWARANGWALLTMTELLDVLPKNHPGRKAVMEQFKAHVKGLASYQSGSGFWHQLLDRNDSYLETSATAIYTYCIAHACSKGWIDPVTYAPMAMLAWNAVASKVTDKGQVEGTCVGTGMAFDPAFYYHRPINVFAAHGYGPVLMAGSAIYQLMEEQGFKMNDSSLQFYKKDK